MHGIISIGLFLPRLIRLIHFALFSLLCPYVRMVFSMLHQQMLYKRCSCLLYIRHFWTIATTRSSGWCAKPGVVKCVLRLRDDMQVFLLHSDWAANACCNLQVWMGSSKGNMRTMRWTDDGRDRKTAELEAWIRLTNSEGRRPYNGSVILRL